MTVSGMKRSADDMQVDSDFLNETAGTSIIQSINECVIFQADMRTLLIFFLM